MKNKKKELNQAIARNAMAVNYHVGGRENEAYLEV